MPRLYFEYVLHVVSKCHYQKPILFDIIFSIIFWQIAVHTYYTHVDTLVYTHARVLYNYKELSQYEANPLMPNP
jgi:hypothetical protein